MKQLPVVNLRALEPEDLEIMYAVENDRELWDVGITNVPYSRYVLREYIAQSTGDIYADRQVRLVICNARGQVVGMADLVNFSPRHRRAEVGLVILKDCQGQGYGQAALVQLADYARRILHIHQLYAVVGKNNVRCQTVFKAVGFQQDAELKGWLYDGEDYYDAMLMQFFL